MSADGLQVLAGARPSIFACLADTVVAPGRAAAAGRATPTRSRVRRAAWPRRAAAQPRRRCARLLLGLELAPLALGFGARGCAAWTARRARAPDRPAGRAAAPARPEGACAALAHLSYYGDHGVHARPRLRPRRGRRPRACAARRGRTLVSAPSTRRRPRPPTSRRRIVRGRATCRASAIVAVDACVIGTGAGGAPVAKELAEGGMRVAMLEEGEWHVTDEFTARPRDMTAAALPRRRPDRHGRRRRRSSCRSAARSAARRSSTPAPASARPPRARAAGARSSGWTTLTAEALDPFFDRVERDLSVAEVRREPGRAPTRRSSSRGAEALGLRGDFLLRNARGCVGSGVCAFGCPSGAKQHAGITYVPARLGGRRDDLHRRARASIVVERRRRRARSSPAPPAGGALRVRCEHVVVACGALHDAAAAAPQRHRHRRPASSGATSRSTRPRAARGLSTSRSSMWNGVPQCYYVDELAGEGDHVRGHRRAARPGARSRRRASGAEHRELMLAGAQHRDVRRDGPRHVARQRDASASGGP